MLPTFPQFKKLELSDKQEVEKITSEHPPYSDFNFVSMWSWNIKDEMQVAQLHGNLVVRFTDYISGEPFYSFLGKNKVGETIKKLLHFSLAEELRPRVSLVPNHSLEVIESNEFKVEEDMDNFDYIYDLEEIAKFEGSKFQQKRNKTRNFLKSHGTAKIKILDLKDADVVKKILDLDKFWSENKIKKDANFKIKNELLATERFFQANFDEAVGVGIFVQDKLVGYSIFSILPKDKYSISHFTKADTNYKGVYDYLMHECAKILLEQGCLYLNHEQDLGIPGLRENKKSFMAKFLKKFVVSFPH